MQNSSSSISRTARRSSIFSIWAEDAVRNRRSNEKKVAPIAFQGVNEVYARRQSSFSIGPLTIPSTVVFVDLEGYSKTSDMHQKWITRHFMSTLRDVLTDVYGSAPSRTETDDYVILPTGDGAAICVMRPPHKHSSCTCSECSAFQCTEETALWIGASLLLWASKRNVGLRVGLNSGDLTIVEDPYGDANVCGDAINLASRIMDTASPGQILAASDSVVPKLVASIEDSRCECEHCPRMYYDIASEPSEIVVKHGVTTHVHSIICTLTDTRISTDLLDIQSSAKERSRSYTEDELFDTPVSLPSWKEISFASLSSSYTRQSTTQIARRHTSFRSTLSTSLTSSKQSTHLSHSIGSHDVPKTKWYMKIKPTEMQVDANHIRPKILPKELIRRHKHIAFIGITHDNLYKVFKEALETDPTLTWDQVYIFYPSDGCLQALASNLIQTGDELINLKNTSKRVLLDNLSNVVDDLRLLELDQLMHCGSYWDWRDQGGYIHISPLTWGCNPKTCPAMNYYWNSTNPSPEYSVYKSGLEYLLNIASPLA